MRAVREKEAIDMLVTCRGAVCFIQSLNYKRSWQHTNDTSKVVLIEYRGGLRRGQQVWAAWRELTPHVTRSGRTHRR